MGIAAAKWGSYRAATRKLFMQLKVDAKCGAWK